MPSSYSAANEMLNVIRNKPTLTVGMFTTVPTRAGTGGVEITGAGYARQPISFAAPANGQMSNSNAIQLPQATSSWGTVKGFGLFDAATGGTLLWFGVFPQSIVISTGAFFIFKINDLTLIEGECP